MRCFSASICESSESNPEAFFAPITGAGFGAEDAEPFCFLLLRWRSASSTACFATSAMALAWRARARASAASRATRSFSLSIWLARLSNGEDAGALAGLRPSGEPSPPDAEPSASAASRRARSASRAAHYLLTGLAAGTLLLGLAGLGLGALAGELGGLLGLQGPRAA